MLMNDVNDELILAARLLLATLFLIFGWRKLRDFSGTIKQMVQLGVPVPVLAAAVALFMELPVAFAVAVARSRVLQLYLCFSTRWEPRLLGIAIGQ
jgi:putative oxidoreductase